MNTNADWINLTSTTEHPGVDIAANGNILIGWENDGTPITDFEACWTMYDSQGNSITPLTVQTNRDVSGQGACGTTYLATTNKWLSFFRDDNTAIGGYTGWGGSWPKANRFGNGLAWSAMTWEIGLEISELSAVNTSSDGDDWPSTQLLNNDGTPLRGEAEFLANGNIATVGDSRQAADRALTGQASGNVTVYRVWTPSGLEVHSYAAASSEPIASSINRGLAATANGFAIRWGAENGQGIMRLFDNSGNPVSTNLYLTNITGHVEVGGGGDGGNCGFHGNGTDAYVWATSGGSPSTPWVSVINADGTLRWSRKVEDASDPIDNTGTTNVDASIDAS
ncbi:MAG: hypothetical protein NT167_27290, partial [Verrucomicrobia bacterium]|nr:hypothetical protein [Verrucomicrobiota bacterium]